MQQYTTDVFHVRANASQASEELIFELISTRNSFYHEYVGAATMYIVAPIF